MNYFDDFDLKGTLNDYKDMLFQSKKYLLIYLVLIFVMGLSTIYGKIIFTPKFLILTFLTPCNDRGTATA